jgi:predicted DCC family thiol-disulfide oxidoreductase YuxK
MSKSATIIYDSECSLCVRFKKALQFLDVDKHITFKSLHDNGTYIDYPELVKEECEELIHLIDETGKIYRGGDVIEYLVKLFPGVKKFAWLLDSESAKNAMDAFYGRLNDMRIMKQKRCYTCGNGKKTRR